MLELAPRLGISLIWQVGELYLVEIVDCLLVATFHSKGIVEVVGIEGDGQLVTLLQIEVLPLLAIIHLGIERVHAIEPCGGLAFGELKLAHAPVIHQDHVVDYGVLDIKMHRYAIGGARAHCHEQE